MKLIKSIEKHIIVIEFMDKTLPKLASMCSDKISSNENALTQFQLVPSFPVAFPLSIESLIPTHYCHSLLIIMAFVQMKGKDRKVDTAHCPSQGTGVKIGPCDCGNKIHANYL